MEKYTLTKYDEGSYVITHNIYPEMEIAVIVLETPYEYKGISFSDVFDEIIIRGWHHVFLVVNSDIDFDDVEDFSQIRSIIQRAAKWYKSKVLSGEIPLEPYVNEEQPTETEDFILQKHSQPNKWIATHKHAKICVEFIHGKFNDTQRVVALEDFNPDDFMNIARYVRELTDWLAVYHRDKV